MYDGCPRVERFDLPQRLARADVFPKPFNPSGDTDFAAEFGSGGRNAKEASVLYMACAWLQNPNNSLADYKSEAYNTAPTLSASLAVTASARTHVYLIYSLLATRYEVLFRWRADPTYAASLPSAVMESHHTPFTNAATAGYHELAARDRAMHVPRTQGRVLARLPAASGECDAPSPAWSRGGGGGGRGGRGDGGRGDGGRDDCGRGRGRVERKAAHIAAAQAAAQAAKAAAKPTTG